MRALILATALFVAAIVAPPPAKAYSDQEISQFLMSSPWCYFRYSEAGGTTSTRRGQFGADGMLSVQSEGEIYSSGSGGTYVGGSSGGEQYQWRVQGGVLLLSQDGASWSQHTLDAYENSSGYPILIVDGDEYSQCN